MIHFVNEETVKEKERKIFLEKVYNVLLQMKRDFLKER